MVARDRGTMVNTALRSMPVSTFMLKRWNTVLSQLMGRPSISAAATDSTTFARDAGSKIMEMTYEPRTPRRMGMILVMPLPQMLKQITMTIAETATSQFALQLVIAEEDRIRPMEMMMGPVTIGGKNFITFFTPKALNSADRITYISPAQATPKQA